MQEIKRIIKGQREFFESGKTLDVKWRIEQLKRLRRSVLENSDAMVAALKEDLGRDDVEGYLCDVGPIIVEIDELIAGVRRWARPERHFSGLMCWPSIWTKVYKMPYGVTLVISPFNFPFLLTFGVVAASMAGGNTAVIKCSNKSKNCTRVIADMVRKCFPPEYVTVVEGGHDVADMLLEERWDKIFYTGSPAVGRHVMEMAARHLTPVALELGGETGNWCVVRKDADLRDAARKIVFFKLLNAGQICININQVAVAREVAEEFVGLMKEEFERQIGPEALTNDEYPKLITTEAWDKCAASCDAYRDRVIYGGKGDRGSRRFEPTVIYPVADDEELVQRELFCPLLPVVPYDDENEILKVIARREHPLALYLFTRDVKWAKRMMQRMQYGGGCINEVCIHLMVKGVPFNGVGHSGMGAYHGVWGFREFTHPQTVLEGKSRLNLPLREHPYTKWKMKVLRAFFN